MESNNAVTEYKNFYFNIISPMPMNVVIKTNIDHCFATNAVSGHLSSRAYTIVIGKRADHDIVLKISGMKNQRTEHYVVVPAKTRNDKNEDVDSRLRHWKPVESNSYMEKLWAFLTIKQALQNPQPENMIKIKAEHKLISNQDCLHAAHSSEFGFNPNLTTLMATEMDLEDPNYSFAFPPK